MTRSEFPRRTRKTIIDRANGHCEGCSAKLKTGEGEIDHVLPCALGGDNSPANGRLLCRVCHKAKTADDIRRTRKADRQRDKATGAIQPQGRMQGRQFAKKARAEKLPVPAPRKLYEVR